MRAIIRTSVAILVLSAVAAVFAVPSPAAAAAAAPVLRYPAAGGDQVEGTLEANGSVVIDYDMARLPQCRSRYAGGDAWSIGVHYRFDGGPVQTQPVTRLDENRQNVKSPVTVDLPLGARDLELWFRSGDRAGCSEYDSRSGANYHYTIDQPAVATFRADWQETLAGEIRAGRGLVVDYDSARLPQCRETYNGAPAWRIDVLYRFGDGAPRSAALTDAGGAAAPTTIAVAAGAQRAEMWFRVTGQRSGCTAYDSDFGRNYTFPVV